MRPSDVTGLQLGRVALVYLAMTVAVITLAPFRFEAEPVNPVSFGLGAFDVAMNVVMFVPIGFIYVLALPQGSARGWLGAVALGAVLSAVVEAAQFFAPGRFPSPVDLTTNTSGAAVGAWLAARAVERRSGSAALRASFVDLPLMALVYLMAPLLWLVGVGGAEETRMWISLPLTVAAGWAISSVLTSFDRAPRPRLLLVTTAWLVVALMPIAVRSATIAATLAGAGLAAAWLRAGAPARLTHEPRERGSERRFEATTLRVVAPFFGMYLLLSSLTPVAPPSDAWIGTLGLVPAGQALTDVALFGALERIAAFTLMGYAIAEYHGRSRDRFRMLLPTVLAWSALASTGLELLRGWHPEHGASAPMLVLTLLGAVLGGWLYVLQLAHVRALSSRPAAA